MNVCPARVIATIVLSFVITNATAQSRFKSILNAAYDSSAIGNYTAAIALLYEAALLKNSDTGYNESINLYFGNNYEALNKIDSSVYYYGEALKYFEDEKDDASLAFLYNRLGSAEINFTKRYRKAAEYFGRQVYHSAASGDSASIFDCYNNIGIAYKLLGQYDSALHYFKLVADDGSQYNTAANRALLFIADTYSLSHQFKQSLAYYDEAINSLLPRQDSTYLFIAYLNKGDCLMKQSRYPESMSCFINAQHYLNAAIADNDRKELFHNLANVFNQTGDFRKAFYYKNLEAALKDSINTANIQEAAAEAEAKYNVRRSQDSLLISRQNLALSRNESRVNQRNFIIVLVVAVAFSILAFAAFRNAQIRKRINATLEMQKQKVESLARELEQANQTKTKLFSVISHDLRGPISALYAVLKLQEMKANAVEGDGVSSRVTGLLDTMEDLLVWSKSQMQKFTLQPVHVELGQLYTEMIALYQPSAENRGITIINQVTERVQFVTDENLLKTILRNVLSNAIGHATDGSNIIMQGYNTANGAISSITNEGSEDEFKKLEATLNQASFDSGPHGLGVFLMKEFLQKLHASIDISYLEQQIVLQLFIPDIRDQVFAGSQAAAST